MWQKAEFKSVVRRLHETRSKVVQPTSVLRSFKDATWPKETPRLGLDFSLSDRTVEAIFHTCLKKKSSEKGDDSLLYRCKCQCRNSVHGLLGVRVSSFTPLYWCWEASDPHIFFLMKVKTRRKTKYFLLVSLYHNGIVYLNNDNTLICGTRRKWGRLGNTVYCRSS